jgi:hypothetical protein
VLVLSVDSAGFALAATGRNVRVLGEGGRKCLVLCVTVVADGVLDRLGACASKGVFGALGSLGAGVSPDFDLIDKAEGALEAENGQ